MVLDWTESSKYQIIIIEMTFAPPSSRSQVRQAMKFVVTLDRDEDGMWVVECPSIPGCVSQGKTKEEALENIREGSHRPLS